MKAIQYSFVQELNGKNIYNLGFGDYDFESDIIVDDINTNNGDAYKVFKTVLSTIPIFFENYSSNILMIQGSDGRPEFIEQCRLACKKKCINECKNYNRRITIYCSYINKNYERLSADYHFFGGIKNQEQQTLIEPYQTYKGYDLVFLLQKMYNFMI